MIARLVAWSLDHRALVTLLVVALVILGGRGYVALPVDAVPDITNVQVQVLTNAPGLSPLEVEQLITRPVELSLFGLPKLKTIRSVSRAAVSAVTVIFDDDADPQLARSLVSQRLPNAREAIGNVGKRTDLGPFSTGLGEVYHFTISWDGHDARDVRTMFDWEIATALRAVPGVVEVNAWGGRTRQIEVRLRTADMRALDVSQHTVEEALLAGGESAGAGAIERGEEQIAVRFDGQYRTAAQISEQIVATRRGGIPIRVRDIADVVDGEAYRTSAATADGKGETVYAMVQMIAFGNAHTVVTNVKARVAELQGRLPAGVHIETFYDRSALVERVLDTVKHSLLEGGAIVVVVLFLLLGDLAAGLVVATAIPLAMLGAFAVMTATGMSGNLMSLGAIDFGLVVDGAVVVVEGALATMAARKISAREALLHEGRAVGGPIAFGVFIIALVYAPVLLLEGIEGKMFRPMAWTVLFALGTAFALTFTWVPVLSSVLLRKIHEREPALIRLLRSAYSPLLDLMLSRRWVPLLVGVLLLGVGIIATRSLGAEFIPRLEEGDLVVQVTRPPSVSMSEAVIGTRDIERVLQEFPEVERVVSRTGSPDVATDVMGIEQSDVFIILRKNAPSRPREVLATEMESALRRALPGTTFSFSQPIDMRFQELIGGVKSDVGIKIQGDDLAVLTSLAEEVERMLAEIPGATDIRAEQTRGLTLATLRPDPERAGRLGVPVDEVRATVQALRAGRIVGQLVEAERRFEVAVRLADMPPPTEVGIADVPIVTERGATVRLGDVTNIRVDDGPAIIGREQARRRVLVEANVRGRDLNSVVQEVQQRLTKIPRPVGYAFVISGQYEHLAHATMRLAVIVPMTLLAIVVLLYFSFAALRPALLIFLNVPVAASGGLVALALRGMPLSISAAVGFIALFGVATLNGVVLLSAVRHHEREGASPFDAARAAALERMRPVLTTAVVAALGFLPMMMATGTGAEVQRPLATVVVGGIVTATILTLGLLPAFWVATSRSQRLVPQPTTPRTEAVAEDKNT